MKLTESQVRRILRAAHEQNVENLESWLSGGAELAAANLLRNARLPRSQSTVLSVEAASAIVRTWHEPADPPGPDRLREHAEQVGGFDASHRDDPAPSHVELHLGAPAPSGDGKRVDLGELRRKLDREFPGRAR